MSRMKDAIIACWDADAIPVPGGNVKRWRAAGYAAPTIRVPVTGYAGKTIMLRAMRRRDASVMALRLDGTSDGRRLIRELTALRGYRGMVAPCRCAACGIRGQRHYFVETGAETLCVNCG
jgi:hypothetical protein